MRCLLIAGLAAALARPTLKGTGLKGKEGAPLAVALVLDNSLRMQYVYQNHTRLERAADMALELVEKLPEDAAIAVCDLGRAANGFAPDNSAAASRLHNLRTSADVRPLAEVVVEAIQLAAEREDRRQEVFVFSDLAAAAWPADGLKAIDAAMAEAPDVRIYVVDCGVEKPQNASLGELELRRAVLRPGEALHLEATVSSNLEGESPLVELSLADEEGRLEKRDQRLASLDDQGQARVEFDVAQLPLGTHQGSVQLVGADPLPVDNTRYFTVEVRPPARVLLLAEKPADALFVREALSASGSGGTSRFQCDVRPLDAIGEAALEDFQAVLLLDPGALSEETWNRLNDFVAGGGGVGVFLGHNASGELASFLSEAALRLLPGKLKRISHEETYLRPRRLDHPALAGLRDYAEELPWQLCHVFSFWQFDLGGDAYTIAGYANDEPAILERSAGRGRALTVTTPFSDPLQPEGREAWNTLPAEPWPFVALVDQLVGYLAQDGEERFEYLAGETARLRLAPNQQVANYVLRLPDGQATRGVTTAGDEELAVSITDALGNYRLTAGGQSQRLDRGFSVNAAAELSELKRIDPQAIEGGLPKDRVHMADNLDAVEKYVNIGRSGRELYSWAIALVAVIWGAEHLLANRFYAVG
jgi:hypothetical protein